MIETVMTLKICTAGHVEDEISKSVAVLALEVCQQDL